MNTKQLRQKILDLAIRGKLVPQDPNDEPASVLLERIRNEKERLIKEGKIKADRKAKAASTPTDKSHYGELPDGWEVTSLEELFYLQAGKFVSADNIIADCSLSLFPCYGGNGLRGYIEKYNRDGNYPLIGRQGALCGNLNYATGKFYATEHAVVVESFAKTNPRWAFYFLDVLNLNQYATATAQPGLSVKTINEVIIPLPPLAEQERIVNVIESTFAVIDEIERNKADLQTAVTMAKRKILSLAIQGKLVPQDPSDEPASVLLDRIKAERAALIKAGKIKPDKRKKSAEITRDNSHYTDIPDSWLWCKLDEIGLTNIGLTYKPADICKDGVPVLRSCNIKNGKLDFSDVVRVSTPFGENLELQAHDILICARNGSRHLVGKCAIIPENSEKMTFGAFMAVFRSVCSQYVYHFLNTDFFRQVFDSEGISTQINQLTQAMIKETMIPLPPLAEQRRIVTAIESAFSQLDNIASEL